MTKNTYEYAIRNKLRFPSARGPLRLEQLWEVPLRGSGDFNLNAIAKAASKATKDAAEESFVDETARTPEHVRLEATFEIVKHVIETKKGEEEAAQQRSDNKQEREKLLKILAEKKEGKLSALSEAELERRIRALS